METKKTPKNPKNFYCKNCDFISSNKKDYMRHLSTDKHKWKHLETEKTPKIENLCSKCGKSYKTRSGLWKHSKICTVKKNKSSHKSDASFVNKVLEDNKELHNIMLHQQEQIDKLIPKVGDTYNNQLNINIFLNEDCKDALNIQDFVKSLRIEISDLANTKNNNLEQGISDIFSKALSDMNIHKRPIHCTDIKRKTLYVKDNETWNKENNNDTVIKAINEVATLQCKSIDKWTQEHPNWNNDEKLQQEYLELVESTTGQLDEKQTNKVIKNIADKTHIN